jgi:predicted alpha/beta hydrolase family esterase
MLRAARALRDRALRDRAQLQGRLREARAVLRQATLLPYDVGAPLVPTSVAPGEHVVVFLHGLFASAGVLRPLRTRFLAEAQIRTAALSYAPGPEVASLTARLRALVDALPSETPVHVVGHSLGGIVARDYARAPGSHRLRSIVTLASPFGGVRGAARFGFGSARDLDPESQVLRELRSQPIAVPHLSLLARDDGLTTDHEAHRTPGSELQVVAGVGHHSVLFDPRVAELVLGFVRRHVGVDPH